MAVEKNDFIVYGLESDSEIILCNGCWLEEVLSNQGGLLEALNIRKEEATAAIRYLKDADALITKDKYCLECEKRLSLTKLILSYTKN